LLVEERVPKRPGYASVSVDEHLPVLLDLYYSSCGEIFSDVSLYMLGGEFVQSDDLLASSVRFSGLGIGWASVAPISFLI
jgi:hypothetical protein